MDGPARGGGSRSLSGGIIENFLLRQGTESSRCNTFFGGMPWLREGSQIFRVGELSLGLGGDFAGLYSCIKMQKIKTSCSSL